MTAHRAATLHVGIGGVCDVAFCLCFTGGAGVGTVSMRPAVLWWASWGSASLPAATAMSIVAAPASAATATAVSLIMVVICAVHLGLEGGYCRGEGRHLVEHLLALLGRICHIG